MKRMIENMIEENNKHIEGANNLDQFEKVVLAIAVIQEYRNDPLLAHELREVNKEYSFNITHRDISKIGCKFI